MTITRYHVYSEYTDDFFSDIELALARVQHLFDNDEGHVRLEKQVYNSQEDLESDVVAEEVPLLYV